jgi:subtilisin family serine protease
MSGITVDNSFDGINADLARDKHGVSGSGITVAVVDSGCFAEHAALSSQDGIRSRVSKNGRNFSGVGDDRDTTDVLGHGTAVSGVIAANAIGPGIAPAAQILPLKAAVSDGGNELRSVLDALSWLLAEGSNQGVTVACLSLGDRGNYQTIMDVPSADEDLRRRIVEKIDLLRHSGIAIVVPAGNRFRCHGSKPGMAFPAIVPSCLSVGAIFRDNELKNFSFGESYCGAEVDLSAAGQVAPFSQRLPRGHGGHFTRLFAPGVAITSLGTAHRDAEQPMLHGTSVAAPFAAGVVALLQEWHKAHIGNLPTCDALERWLLQGADRIVDDAGIDDNVDNTGATFKSLNAMGAIDAMIAEVSTS